MEVKYLPFQQHLCSEASTHSKSQQCLAHNCTLQLGGKKKKKQNKSGLEIYGKERSKITLYEYKDHCTRIEQIIIFCSKLVSFNETVVHIIVPP